MADSKGEVGEVVVPDHDGRRQQKHVEGEEEEDVHARVDAKRLDVEQLRDGRHEERGHRRQRSHKDRPGGPPDGVAEAALQVVAHAADRLALLEGVHKDKDVVRADAEGDKDDQHQHHVHVRDLEDELGEEDGEQEAEDDLEHAERCDHERARVERHVAKDRHERGHRPHEVAHDGRLKVAVLEVLVHPHHADVTQGAPLRQCSPQQRGLHPEQVKEALVDLLHVRRRIPFRNITSNRLDIGSGVFAAEVSGRIFAIAVAGFAATKFAIKEELCS
mmetsp:Transcript_23564/g.56337  ORF Transcript_23564/g.56337 Transcript_23564/m.56337 type:complete len:275 (+) Transcript_23564:2-826(+)